MKTETLTERTRGEWKVITHEDAVYVSSETFGGICFTPHNGKHREEHEANAAFICKAVNNYDSLVWELQVTATNLHELESEHTNLKAINDSLLNALKWVVNLIPAQLLPENLPNVKEYLREAIKKAEQ